jgi:hypothetical protein
MTIETEQTVLKKIRKACSELLLEVPTLLERELHERTITARLALYLQPKFGGVYFVDCEYSRMFDPAKGKDVPKAAMNWPKSRIYPDIIIHKRTPDNKDNLAVIEAKWQKNSEREPVNEEDKVRVYMTETKLRYEFGFILIINDGLIVTPVTKELRT